MPHETAPLSAAQICALNDAFRRSFTGGRVVVTAGVAALPEDTRTAVLAVVQAFDRFDPDNDPHQDHDFGAVTVGGVRVFWKIDSNNPTLAFASPNPADATVTIPVITVMLAERH